MSELVYHTLEQRPDLKQAVSEMANHWETFMRNDDVSDQYFGKLYDWFPEFQLAICDAEDRVVAKAHSMPIKWDGDPNTLPEEGWNWALMNGVETREKGESHTAVSAIEINILPEMRGTGLSSRVLGMMKANVAARGFDKLVAPVRPNLKSRYPLTPMERYITWTRDDSGAPFDPWLRVHWRLGAPIVKVAPRSMRITGTIAEWEEWTNMSFPETGDYIVPGALTPVQMDIDKDIGVYIEPNVWMLHTVE